MVWGDSASGEAQSSVSNGDVQIDKQKQNDNKETQKDKNETHKANQEKQNNMKRHVTTNKMVQKVSKKNTTTTTNTKQAKET